MAEDTAETLEYSLTITHFITTLIARTLISLEMLRNPPKGSGCIFNYHRNPSVFGIGGTSWVSQLTPSISSVASLSDVTWGVDEPVSICSVM